MKQKSCNPRNGLPFQQFGKGARVRSLVMNVMIIMTIGLAVLSVASGMLGLGVAFAAGPFLGLWDFLSESK